jgi:hypothetical protein
VPIPNSDFVPDPFPGIRLPSGTGAPGLQGASGEAADDIPAGPVTRPDGAWYPDARRTAPWSRGNMTTG